MDLEELVEEAREVLSAEGVYAKPYRQNGLTVIPAAAVRGGAGGGGGTSSEGQGRGMGLGLKATPSGAWVIEGSKVEWKPAFDLNRAIFGGELVALAGILTARALLVRPRPTPTTWARRPKLRRSLRLPTVRFWSHRRQTRWARLRRPFACGR